MGKLPYPFPLETSKDNRTRDWRTECGQYERGYSPCLYSLADWIAETCFIVVAKGRKTFNHH